jgi:hypothetical protein
MDEQLSPVCDYSNITPDLQVKVGISPTDDQLNNTKTYQTQYYSEKHQISTNDQIRDREQSSQKQSFDSPDHDYKSSAESAYENNAFAGQENIDSFFSIDSGQRSPYEVVREKFSRSDSDSKSNNKKLETKPKHTFGRSKSEDKDNLRHYQEEKRIEIIDNKLEGKVMKQIVSEIFAKELEEEIVNGSPERKIIHKVTQVEDLGPKETTELKFEQNISKNIQKTESDDDNYEEIRKEASIIAQTIVGKAKEELARMPLNTNISSDISLEISDEDLVEQGSDDNEDLDKPTIDDLLTSPCIESDEIDGQNVELTKAQKRISFTESDTFIIKEESFEDKSAFNVEQSLSPDDSRKTSSDPRKSSDSGSRSGSQKEKESGSSSESHYHSFDVSDSSKTPVTSRPTSSEFDLTIIPEQQCLSGRSGSGSGGYGLSASEYETCVTSQEGSYATAATSQDTTYCTALTSLDSHTSSRESTISIESESSGHLGEISSEGSETIIPGDDREMRASLSDDDYDQNGSVTPVNDEIKEPFDWDIPESVIRSGNELPFMSGSNWEVIEQRDSDAMASSSFEIISSDEIESIPLQSGSNSHRASLLQSNNSIEEAEQPSLSENSMTWHSSSVATAIHITGQPNSGNGSIDSLGQISGCADSTQSVFRSFSDSISSLDNLNSNEGQQTVQISDGQLSLQISEPLTYTNGPVQVDYNPEYDVSDNERGSTQSSNAVVQQYSQSQDERTSSSDTQLSDTPLVSQSSFCSSVLSEHTRHQLSYDFSPEVPHVAIADSLTLGSDDLQRPESPIPPEVEEFVFLESNKESNEESLTSKSSSNESSNLLFDKNLMAEGSHGSEHTDLYTHQEVDEDIDESATLSGTHLAQSKPIPILPSRSGESSAASSLKEFERLEAEMTAKGKGSPHGSSDSLGSSSGKPMPGRGSDRDDHSVSSSINEFEKLEKDCNEAESIERAAREEAARLSEIEEGHESQASDASQETLSDPGNSDDDTDSDYEKRMSEIDDMMKLAQNNVEKMHGISRGADNSVTSDTLSTDMSLTDNLKDDKLKRQSQCSSANAAQLLLMRKVMSTESMDSHPRSSISTTNTESLFDRIEDLDEVKVEYKDENKSIDSDSLHEDHENIQELEFQTDITSTKSSSVTESLSSLTHESTHAMASDSGPALATLREENDFDEDSLKESFHGILKGGDCMLSSTDSLEMTSPAATHATYHLGSGSQMSSSYQTSGDESTMISSSETPDLLFGASPDLLEIVDQQYSNNQNNQLKRLFDNERKLLDQSKTCSEQSSTSKCDDNNPNPSEGELEEIQTYDERGNLKIFRRVKRSVPPPQTSTSSSSDNEEKFLEMLKKSAEPGTEVIEEEKTFDESGSLIMRRTVKTVSTEGPAFKSKLVTGLSADKETEDFLEPYTKLESVTNVDEYEGIDESGNPFKVYQEVTIMPEVRAVTFTGPDAQQKLDQFMNTWTGDKNQLIEINNPLSNTNTTQTFATDSVKPDTQSGSASQRV